MSSSRRARTTRVKAVLVAAVVSALVPLQSAPAEETTKSVKQVIRLALPGGGAATAKPRSVFRAETEGSPQPTIVGGWSEGQTSSNEGRLSFAGVHAVGDRTTFLGSWISPATTSSKSPQMNIDYELGYSNALGERIPITHAVRARFAGGRWGPWAVAKTPIPPQQSTLVSGNVTVLVPLEKPRRVQFQWKIQGKIAGPAAIEGDFRVSAS